MEQLKQLALSVGIGEACRITGATTTQIRYWEKKGIVTSFQHNDTRNKRYDLPNIMRIIKIKHFLDEGFTLAAAIDQVNQHHHTADRLRVLAKTRMHAMNENDRGETCINFGAIDNDPEFDIVATISDTEARLNKVPRG